jgi:hypothetical protein
MFFPHSNEKYLTDTTTQTSPPDDPDKHNDKHDPHPLSEGVGNKRFVFPEVGRGWVDDNPPSRPSKSRESRAESRHGTDSDKDADESEEQWEKRMERGYTRVD